MGSGLGPPTGASPHSLSAHLNPMSASIKATLYPRRAMLIPRLAEEVVLPTPPYQEET